jgi:chemotaxis response regulator CheB
MVASVAQVFVFEVWTMLIEVKTVPKKQTEPPRRVLVVEGGSLVEEGIENLLSREPDLQVIGVPFAGESALLQNVVDLHPDVILINESGPLTSERILELLKSLPKLASLRVIMVRADDSTIDVFEHQRVDATEVDDLLNLIRSEENHPE